MSPSLALRAAGPGGAAGAIAELVAPLVGGSLPIRLRAWDGSEAGPDGGPVLVLRSRKAVRRLLWSPGELGLAQAYVTGELDVEGDLAEGFRQVWRIARERGVATPKPDARLLAKAAVTALRLGVVGPRPKAPASQAKLDGGLHTRLRDRAAISYHYDLSNQLYALLLDEAHMAYSCAYWTSDAPEYTLADAQRDKLDLICSKLDLRPGSRLLDCGCGWGALSLHAAEHYGASVVGITLSSEQRAHVLEQVRARGLEHLVEIRLQDYREVSDGPFDAAASIEMGEHVGAENYPVFTQQLHDLIRPGGRVLIQQMSRTDMPGGGPFIESFIAPDMYMRPVGQTVELIENSGLEVRDVQAMREHYTLTIEEWLKTFERRWDEVVDLVGEEVGRVWRLYLVGGALTFEEGRMGVDQILAERRQPGGLSGMPPTPTWHTAHRSGVQRLATARVAAARPAGAPAVDPAVAAGIEPTGRQ